MNYHIIAYAALLLLLAACGQAGTTAPAPTASPVVSSPATSPAPASAVSGDPEQGQLLFTGQVVPDNVEQYTPCSVCHYRDASQGVLLGPNLAGVYERAATRVEGQSADEYLRRSIMNHDEYVVEGFHPEMLFSSAYQDYGEFLTPEQIEHLVAYLKTLEAGGGTSDAPGDTAPAAAPQPLGEPLTVDADGYVTSATGVALQLAEGWQAHAVESALTLHPADATVSTAPAIALRAGTTEDLNIPNVDTAAITTTEEFFRVMLTNFQDEMFDVTLGTPKTLLIDGVPVQVVSFSGSGLGDLDGAVAGRLAVARLDATHSMVMIGTAAPPEAWDADGAFDAMLASVTFDGTRSTGSSTPASHAPHYAVSGIDALPVHHRVEMDALPVHSRMQEEEVDRRRGPRFACVNCHITHEVEMGHDSNPSCHSCHSGTVYQRHCVDCHSIHGIGITHDPNNPDCASCHSQGIPGAGVSTQATLVTFLSYLFHDV